MADSKTQDFSNHARYEPGYHFVTLLLAVMFFVWSVVRLVKVPSGENSFFVVGAAALLGVAWYTRAFPLKAQDRIIRLEEQLRLARVLPATQQAMIDRLSERHLVAMRFAPDAELPELVQAVLANPAMTPKEIKQRIRNWRPDHFRV